MRDKEHHARSVLGLCVRELEQASREFVELLGDLPENHPIFASFAAHPEIGPAFGKCREKLLNKSRAFKRWKDSLNKGSW